MQIPGIIPANTLPVLERAMDLRAARHNLIVSNIANMDTPGYKAFDVAVEEELERMSETSDGLEKTHPRHLPDAGIRTDAIRPEPVAPPEYSLRGDGNTVDIDTEMTKLTENGILYQALARLVSREFQIISKTIEGR